MALFAPFLALALAAAPANAGSGAPTLHPLAPGGMGVPAAPKSDAAVAPLRLAAVHGTVRDARTGEPLAGALVQQEGAVTSVFTTSDGQFRLLLDHQGGSTLTVSAMGFEDQIVKLAQNQTLDVRLHEVSTFLSTAPLAPLVPVGMSQAESAPLNSAIIFNYSLRDNAISDPGPGGGNAMINGWINNDFQLGARFRYRPWIIEAEGVHYEEPVNLTGLVKEDNPAFKPSTWEAGARVGLMYAFTHDLEGALLLGYHYANTEPNNSGTPFTGSNIDVAQTRHAAGAEAELAYQPGRGPWELELGAGYYPLVYAVADTPGTPFAQSDYMDGHALVSYEIVSGFRVGLGVGLDRWSGTGFDQGIRATLGIHYTPGGVPKGME